MFGRPYQELSASAEGAAATFSRPACLTPFSPTYCVRCKRPNPDGAGLCDECRRLAPAVLTPLQPAPARWSPVRVFLLLLVGLLLL